MYLVQLDRLQEAIKIKKLRCDKVALLHDNARFHMEHRVVESIDSKGWELLPHPPYSPTEATTDYHVNRLLKNWQAGKVYENFDQWWPMLKCGLPRRISISLTGELIDFQANGRQLLKLTVNMLWSDSIYMLSM